MPQISTSSQRSSRLAQCLVIIGLLASVSFSTIASASPRLRCELLRGGETRVLEFAPVTDPYSVKAVDIGRSFRFKAVVIGSEKAIDYIKLYAYYVKDGKAVLMHEAKYLTPAASVTEVAPAPDALTGTHTLYSPVLERELQYGCALFEVTP
jgi:hypothetical protein